MIEVKEREPISIITRFITVSTTTLNFSAPNLLLKTRHLIMSICLASAHKIIRFIITCFSESPEIYRHVNLR